MEERTRQKVGVLLIQPVKTQYSNNARWKAIISLEMMKNTNKKKAHKADSVFYVKSIPETVKIEDFNCDAPVDLDKVIQISKRKVKLNGKK